MYIVNVEKLKGKMVEKGFNNTTFSYALGIGRDTLRSYLKDYSKIPYDILSKMAEVLECDEHEAKAIFFVLKLT
ncbi:MAG: helix-turn-helix domain-containing protein [Clostridia bacterium]|nr:helix-turn-helix domain-containing protein [Clostridia bacterium]